MKGGRRGEEEMKKGSKEENKCRGKTVERIEGMWNIVGNK